MIKQAEANLIPPIVLYIYEKIVWLINRRIENGDKGKGVKRKETKRENQIKQEAQKQSIPAVYAYEYHIRLVHKRMNNEGQEEVEEQRMGERSVKKTRLSKKQTR